MTVRIAAWSGPRNVSTALMRSFEARGDCEVVDEPLYAAFLAATGKDHPGRDEILRSQPTDPAEALRRLQAPGPLPYRYEKHMAHHWQPGWPLDALGDALHVLLIRDPARVVASYAKVREAPGPEDLGYWQQVALAERLPIAAVVDGDELLADPPRVLRALALAVGLPWTDRMLSWAPGRRPTDGVWAPHWYARVEASTGFSPPSDEPIAVPPELEPVVAACRGPYARLRSLTGDSE